MVDNRFCESYYTFEFKFERERGENMSEFEKFVPCKECSMSRHTGNDPLIGVCADCYEQEINELKRKIKRFLTAYDQICVNKEVSDQLRISEEILRSIHEMRLAVYGGQRDEDRQ
jgi:hypothetical protein